MEGARTRGLCQWETKLVMHFRPFLVPIPGIDTILTQASIHTSIVKRVSIGNVKDNHITLRTRELFSSEHIAVHGSITNVELQCNRGYSSPLLNPKHELYLLAVWNHPELTSTLTLDSKLILWAESV